jgi:hypothetical protein
MKPFTLIEPTKVEALSPAILIQIGGEIVIGIDQVGILFRSSLDIFLCVLLGSLVPELKVG